MTDNNRFLDLLTHDASTAQSLLELMEKEYLALSERKLEQLQPLLDEKQLLLNSLNQNAGERSQILARLGLTADKAGFTQFAAQTTISAQLTSLHDQLETLINQCQSANLRNGRLIRANQVSVGQALNIMRGNDGPALYDRSGSTASRGSQRTFTRA